MNVLINALRGTKRATKGGGVGIICLETMNGPIFFYMWLEDSASSPAKRGDRFVSKGDLKSATGVIDLTEWDWAKTWENSKIVPLTSTEFELAIELVKEITEDPKFGYTEENHATRAQLMGKKIEKVVEPATK